MASRRTMLGRRSGPVGPPGAGGWSEVGATNVARVFATWGDLPHVAFRALTYMALVTMDSDKTPRYYGGVEALSVALGRPEVSRADRKAVSDALTVLRRAGAIEGLIKGSRGHRAEYALRLEPVDNPSVAVDTESGQDGKHHDFRDDSTTVFVSKHHGFRNKAPRSAWSQGGLGTRGTEGGATSPLVSTSLVAVPNEPTKSDLTSCPSCRWLAWEGHQPGCHRAATA